MSVERKTSKRALLLGMAVCLMIGGGVFYYQKQNADKAKYIPEMGLPSGEEFLDLLNETRLYWSSKIDFATYLPKRLPQTQPDNDVEKEKFTRPAPVLYIEKFDDLEQRFSPPKLNIIETKAVKEGAKKPGISVINNVQSVEKTPVAVIEDKAVIEAEKENASPPTPPPYRFDIEEETLRVEGVLVPQKTTVISSSRDGKIKDIFVDNGDLFESGDILLTYDCQDLNAEIEAISEAEKLAKQKAEKGQELFKLDIISDLEQMELEVEEKQTLAQGKVLKAQLDSCIIRASYDGRVTNRLANPDEYTRTDRVLMEIASKGALDVEFIVPSRWLRYLNVGAPLNVTIAETNNSYKARIKRIFGEVDPVSQSIQMSAELNDYNDLLLPGMSGLVQVDPYAVRESGIRGYLESANQQKSSDAGRRNNVNTSRLKSLKEKIVVGADNG